MIFTKRYSVPSSRHRQQGLSLIELMISITLGLIILAAIVQVLISSKNAFVLERENAILQENARFAMDALRREVGAGGSTGCRNDSPIANLVGDTATDTLIAEPGITGYEHEDDTTVRPDHYPDNISEDSDTLVVRYADVSSGTPATIIDRALGALNNLEIDPNALIDLDLENGDIAILTSPDCGAVIALSLSEINLSSTVISLTNCVDSTVSSLSLASILGLLGNGLGCDTGGLPELPSLADYKIAKFYATSYFIAPSSLDPSVPALWQYQSSSGEGGGTSEELVQGIENMQILYGEDTDVSSDSYPNQYVKANAVTNWSRVVSIRVSLLIRSILPTEMVAVSQEDFEGIAIAADRHTRRKITSVIHMRNMGAIQ